MSRPLFIKRIGVNFSCLSSRSPLGSIMESHRYVVQANLSTFRGKLICRSEKRLLSNVNSFNRHFSMTSSNGDDSSQKGDTIQQSWKWIPPRARENNHDSDIENVVPIRKGVYMSVEEITKILEHYKGQDIVSIPLGKEKNMDGIDFFILVSGDSSRHIRRLAEAILKQVRKRNLTKATAFNRGIEGEKIDDWLAVDCHNCVVHCLLPETRRILDLESHWEGETRPCAINSGSDKEFENSLDKLFNQYPPPSDLNVHTTKGNLERDA